MPELRAWKFRPGSQESVIRDLLDRGCVILDYETPGLHNAMTRDELIAKLRAHNPDRSEKGIRAHAGQLDTIFNRVKKGDLALVPRNHGRLMMIGKIISDQPSVSGKLIEFKVNWLATDVPLTDFDQDLQYSFMAIHKFCEVSRNGASGRIHKIARGEPDPGY